MAFHLWSKISNLDKNSIFLKSPNLRRVMKTFYMERTYDQTSFVADDFTQTNKGMNPPNGANTFTKITSAAACANLCRQNTKISCQGFYYCASSSTCVLSQSHADTSSSVNSALSCDHYSSKWYINNVSIFWNIPISQLQSWKLYRMTHLFFIWWKQ